MPGFMMPTHKQLKTAYTMHARAYAKDSGLDPLSKAPKGASRMGQYKNVGIPGMKGREDIFSNGMELYVRNRQDHKTRWFDAGPAPMF